jgi:hypothetical protein
MIEAHRNERGYWFVALPRGPHDQDTVWLWLSQQFIPAPRCLLEGQPIEATKAPFSNNWRHVCPKCGRACSDVISREPMTSVAHPEAPVRDFYFPIRGAEVRRTDKGSLVLAPGRGIVHLVTIASRFRGTARITKTLSGEIYALGDWYRSPKSNLGWTGWALVHGPEDAPIEVWGERSEWGAPKSGREVHLRLWPDGRQEEILEPDAGLTSSGGRPTNA